MRSSTGSTSRSVAAGEVDDGPGPRNEIAAGTESLARVLAVVGDAAETRETFAAAAERYTENADACWRVGPGDGTDFGLPVTVTNAVK